jgi:endonuclease/exonuclease/phosphatase family metal-dependent hydrolase
VPDQASIVFRVLSWNLFHGRDFPPDRALRTWRSRLLGLTETNATHAQVNRPLFGEFAALLAGWDWDVAFLQEAPPRWFRPLAERAQASGALALTSRNRGAAARRLAAAVNPDLIASGEGGSNQLLVRAPGRVLEVRRHVLALRPERRTMLFARLELPGGRRVAAANLHATASRGDHVAAPEVVRAAELAAGWSGDDPLVFGGDLNLRPETAPGAFDELTRRLGLAPPTAPNAIDHLLARGLEVVEAPVRLPPERREVARRDGRRIRLSDHAPVVATFGMK